jgi:hypothetical protein
VNQSTPPPGKLVTLLRGDALRDARATGQASDSARSAPAHDTGTGAGTGNSVYGVPVSAVQHCCGRGCKHCRIYWHRLKP